MDHADPRLSAIMSHLDPAVMVVTATDGDQVAGCVVAFATCCSMHPFRFLVGMSRPNATTRIAHAADALVVHVLAGEHLDVAEHFGALSGDDVDKFADVAWRPWHDGTPILSRCAGWFAGPVVARHALGDHWGMVVEPVEAEMDEDALGGAATLRVGDASHVTPGHPM